MPAVLSSEPGAVVAGEIVVAGPPVPRAENDVGGLLDTTKGWTLSIPDPRETSGAASKLIAAQEGKPAKPVETAAAIVGPASGSR